MGGTVSQDSVGEAREMAESASVAQAGRPSRNDDERGPRAEDAPPTPDELDARDEAFSRRRKPMGPVDRGSAETIPDEGDSPSR